MGALYYYVLFYFGYFNSYILKWDAIDCYLNFKIKKFPNSEYRPDMYFIHSPRQCNLKKY